MSYRPNENRAAVIAAAKAAIAAALAALQRR